MERSAGWLADWLNSMPSHRQTRPEWAPSFLKAVKQRLNAVTPAARWQKTGGWWLAARCFLAKGCYRFSAFSNFKPQFPRCAGFPAAPSLHNIHFVICRFLELNGFRLFSHHVHYEIILLTLFFTFKLEKNNVCCINLMIYGIISSNYSENSDFMYGFNLWNIICYFS